VGLLYPKKGLSHRYFVLTTVAAQTEETIMEDPLAAKEQVKRHLSSTPIPSGPSPPNSPGGYINTYSTILLSLHLPG
jgi:hypothetical protein